MAVDVARVKELFAAALDLSGHERTAYLDTACAGDSELRRRLEAMLRTHEDSGELLSRSPAAMLADTDATQAEVTAAPRPPASGSATQAESGDGAVESLAFLEPSSTPGHLGRLGHYAIHEVIGKGGFGVVLKGFDERLHRMVAIKVLAPAYATNGAARQRFIREARTAAAVKNEHVVAIHDVQADADPPYLVMEMIDGVSLQDKIDKAGPLELKEILRIGMQMAEGLAAAHKQGLVHRDIKPANILLENGVERVRITDFGLARAVDDASVTQSGTVAGTPMYMSPEQAEGLPIDHRSDLFSLGTVLYAMCTGHPPFRASGTHAVLKRVIDATPRPIREINNEIPDWLCDIISKLHAKKPEDRFQTAKEVAELLGERLADVQAGREISARRGSPDPAEGSDRRSADSAREAGDLRSGEAAGSGDPRRARSHRPRNRKLILSAIASACLLGVLSWVAFEVWDYQRTNTGVLWVHNLGEFDYSGPQVHVFLQREGSAGVTRVTLTPSVQTTGLEAGSYKVIGASIGEVEAELQAAMHEFRPDRTSANRTGGATFSVTPHQRQRLYVAVFKPQKSSNEPGWTQLFNGRDLTGWHHSDRWHVKDGILVGAGPGFLGSKQNYRDFQCRIKARCNAAGVASISFRGKPYETHGEIALGNKHELGMKAGSFHFFSKAKSDWAARWTQERTNPGEWFDLDLIVQGKKVVAKVNGVTTANLQYDELPAEGLISLNAYEEGTVLEFSKIEIKALPLDAAEGSPPLAIAPFDAAKAKEHQDAWAKHLGVDVEIKNSIDMKLRLTPPGKNALGPNGPGESETPFYAGVTEVTVGQFRRFVDETKHPTTGEVNQLGGMRVFSGKKTARDAKYIWSNPEFAKSDDHPVTLVTWHDAMAFCEWLSKKDKRPYRLPTMSEWRWLERAGAATRLYFADDPASVDANAWLVSNSQMHTHPVGKKARNGWGLFDVNGNAWELAYDWGRLGKPVSPLVEKRAPDANDRIVFLGLGYSNALGETSEANGPPLIGYSHMGFRVVTDRVESPPSPAIAPFDAAKAKEHQDAWAQHLGVELEITNSIGMKLRLIPPGEFTMGSDAKEIDWLLTQAPDLKDAQDFLKWYVRGEGPERRVTIREPFRMGSHEVLVGHFREFVNATKYQTEAEKNGGGFVWNNDAKKWERDPANTWTNPKYCSSETHPVVFVTPADARAFCAWLGEREGVRYELPSEEQWEYACRAGTTTRWYFGDDETVVKKHGWVVPHSQGKHQPAGRLTANPFGLFDVHGNVTELAVTPQGNIYERGGQANESPQRARSASRQPVSNVDETHLRRGFRVVIVGDLKAKTPLTPHVVVKEELGWVQLFNGKDTAAWDMKLSPLWKFEGGLLSSKGGELHSARGSLKNCRLRVEARYFAGEAYVRLAPQAIQEPNGKLRYAHQLIHLHNENGDAQTGSISVHVDNQKFAAKTLEQRTRPGEWFTLEISYRNKHIQTWVNGKAAAEFTNPDPGKHLLGANLAIGVVGKGGELEIRKVELKELSREELD